MPNPAFIPLVGSGFDSLANQRAGLMAYNRAVEEGNINRFDAANQQRNNYLAQLAQVQRQDQARQDALTQAAQDRAVQQQQIQQAAIERAAGSAEERREFDVRSGLETARTNAMYGQQAAERQRQLDQIAQSADFLAPQIGDTWQESDKLTKAAQDAQNELNSAAAKQLAKLNANKVTLNRQTWLFMPKPGTMLNDAEMAALDKANEAYATERGAYNTALEKANTSAKTLASLQADAKASGLLIGRNAKGQVILMSPAHGGKQWVAGEEADQTDDTNQPAATWVRDPVTGKLVPAGTTATTPPIAAAAQGAGAVTPAVPTTSLPVTAPTTPAVRPAIAAVGQATSTENAPAIAIPQSRQTIQQQIAGVSNMTNDQLISAARALNVALDPIEELNTTGGRDNLVTVIQAALQKRVPQSPFGFSQAQTGYNFNVPVAAQ
jgi:hypothetical protein